MSGKENLKSKQPTLCLFKQDIDWHNNACLNWGTNLHLVYSSGYREAAKFLAENAADESMQDIFVYPIAFLYRHHLELQLKLVIHEGRQLLDEGEGFPEHHELGKLWSLAKEIIKEVEKYRNDPSEFELIEYIISEYTKIDPQSMSFRYPRDKKGKKNLNSIKHINLRHLSETIEEACDFLEGMHSSISEYLAAKLECEFEHSQ